MRVSLKSCHFPMAPIFVCGDSGYFAKPIIPRLNAPRNKTIVVQGKVPLSAATLHLPPSLKQHIARHAKKRPAKCAKTRPGMATYETVMLREVPCAVTKYVGSTAVEPSGAYTKYKTDLQLERKRIPYLQNLQQELLEKLTTVTAAVCLAREKVDVPVP